MKVIKDWMLLGSFDSGLKNRPADASKIPKNFQAIQLPDTDLEKPYNGQSGKISWIEHHTIPDSIELRKLFGDAELTYGFGRTYIKSPEARSVFAQVKWGGNLGKVYLNGIEIPTARIPNIVDFSINDTLHSINDTLHSINDTLHSINDTLHSGRGDLAPTPGGHRKR